MKFSTEAISKMAEIMVSEMGKIGLEGEGIREVGAQALGRYLEAKDKEIQEPEKLCVCGEQMNYLFRRKGTILSVFGRVAYRRSYHVCEQCCPDRIRLDRDTRWVGSWTTKNFPSPMLRFLLCLGIDPMVCPPQRPDNTVLVPFQENPFVERYHRNFKYTCQLI
jgi:hypothetical protein